MKGGYHIMIIASLTAVNTALVALGYAWQIKRETA